MTTPTITLAWAPDASQPQQPALDVALHRYPGAANFTLAQGRDVVVWPAARAGELIAAIAEASGIRVQTWERS